MSAVRVWLAAAAVAVAAFLLYHATLLPGQDLGDTASFQAAIGEWAITPRQAYPLYYATGNLFGLMLPVEPARAVNLASAVFAALACGLLAVCVMRLTGRVVAGAVSGLLFATSYTFWSQAIIAEVYALHCFVVALCLLALLAWAARPALWRLALFFALYAAGFGNHLMMVLLLPGFAFFLLLAAPGGVRSLIRPRVVALAVLMAALGAAQYLWNLSYLIAEPGHPSSVVDLFRAFWFDVTKADWRATMVMAVHESAFRARTGMWWFELRQQFGIAGIALALAGAIWLFLPGPLPGALGRVSRKRVGAALVTLLTVSWLFAFTYNVGDTHVFYIPAHFLVALLAGLGAGAMLERLAPALVVALTLLAYPAWRAYDTLPALDRSGDRLPTEFFDRLTQGLSGHNAVFATDLNWQLHNGLDYYTRHTRTDLAMVEVNQVLLHFPFLVDGNAALGRPVVVNSKAASLITAAYGPMFRLEADTRVEAASLAQRVARIPPGTPYVITVLAPYPDQPVDEDDLDRTLAMLTGGTIRVSREMRYNVIAGIVGRQPVAVKSADRPFRLRRDISGMQLDVRLECWLPADSFRRMGFGRVIVNRRPALTLDRGVSFVALRRDGTVVATEYGWSILAPQARWIVSRTDPRRDAAHVKVER